MNKGSFALLLTLALPAMSGCGLFGLGDIPCESDSNCPSDMYCGDDQICASGTAPPRTDAAVVDAAGLDAGGQDALAQDASSSDVPGHDAGVGSDVATTATDANTAGTDAAGTGTDASALPDAASGDLFRPLPDSPTSYCKESQSGSTIICPASGTAAHGQDGNYNIFAPTYRLESSDVVVDDTTGLSWQRDSSVSDRTWAQAVSDCEGSTLGGHDDWRLPVYVELMGLLDLGRSNQPAIDTDAFPGTLDEEHWTATLNAANSSSELRRMIVQFDGTYAPPHYRPEDDRAWVKCVRGTEQRFGTYDLGMGTAADLHSGLTWETAERSSESWVDALRICDELSRDSHDDWRLPSLKEWVTVFDHSQTSVPSLPTIFPDPETWQWTSTPYVRGSGIWVVDVDHGMPNGASTGYPNRFRCVRGGIDQGWE